MIHPSINKGVQLKEFSLLTKQDLVDGKYHCPNCYSRQRANPSRLTSSIVQWAYKALDWCYQNGSYWRFDVQAVFTADEMHGRARRGTPSDAQYLGIVQQTGKANWWEFTMIGRRFLNKKLALTTAAWVKDGVVLWTDPEYKFVDQVDPEWRTHADYLLDYVLLTREQIEAKKRLLSIQPRLI